MPGIEAIFFDPARRISGQALFKLADYSPPISLVDIWRKQVSLIGVKVAPGIRDARNCAMESVSGHVEVEFISVDGELKEAVLWFGERILPGRHATLLAQGRTHHVSRIRRRPTRLSPSRSAYLYEPDPAIIRAHLVKELAHELSAAQLDADIAYLTSLHLNKTPLARCWRVLEWLPFKLKNLRARLRALDAGAVTVKKRGSPLDTDALARQLSGAGSRELVVVLTQLSGKPVALFAKGRFSS